MSQYQALSHGRAPGLFAIVLGVLVAVAPLAYLGPGGIGVGPIGFAVLMIEVIVGAVGLGVVFAGGYSYRTGNPRPAVVAATTVVSLTIVGGVGAYVEMSGGPLIPVWAWIAAGLVAICVPLAVSVQLTSSN